MSNEVTLSAETEAPIFLTPAEVAARWKISEAAIYQRIGRGDLPHVRLAANVRILLSDVERIEREGYVPQSRLPVRRAA